MRIGWTPILLIVLYGAPAFALTLAALGDVYLGQHGGRTMLKRMGLALVWPFALLSFRAREVMLEGVEQRVDFRKTKPSNEGQRRQDG